MKRKDVLAAGGLKATYATSGHAGDEITIRTAMSDADRKKADAATRALQRKLNAEQPKNAKLKKFVPTRGTLLVRRQEAAPVSELVKDTVEQEKPAEGVVLESTTPDFVKGDHVVFGKYSGAEFKLNGETLLLISEDEIKGFLIDA